MIGDLKLAETVAAAMRESVPAGHGPVNLHAIARTLGVAQICLTELATDGMTTWDDGLATIVLSSDVSKLRRRFTLAHELGHVMLGHGGVRHRGDTHQVSEKVEHEEKLCDQIAAALLMPRAAVEELVANELSLTPFLAFAAASEVSPSALAWRVAEVSGKTALLMDLDQGEAGWYIVRTNGRQPWRSQQATVVATSFGVFGDLARTPRDAAMRLGLPSYEVDVFGEAVASFVRGRWQARMLVTAVHRVPPPVIARRS